MTNIFQNISDGLKKGDKASHLAMRGKRQAKKLKHAVKHGKTKKIVKLSNKLAKTGKKGVKNLKGATKMAYKTARKGATYGAEAAMFI